MGNRPRLWVWCCSGIFIEYIHRDDHVGMKKKLKHSAVPHSPCPGAMETLSARFNLHRLFCSLYAEARLHRTVWWANCHMHLYFFTLIIRRAVPGMGQECSRAGFPALVFVGHGQHWLASRTPFWARHEYNAKCQLTWWQRSVFAVINRWGPPLTHKNGTFSIT